MPRFRYQALNASQQTIVAEVEAESVLQAITELESRGLSIQAIGYASEDSPLPVTVEIVPPGNPFAETPPRANDEVENAILRQHLQMVIQRAQAIVPALKAYAAEMSGGRRSELGQVLQVLERGDAAEATLALRRLPSYWIPLLSAATLSPDPGRVLREFITESERAEEMRRQWWLTFAYPLAVIGLALAVMVLLSFLVVPFFHDLYRGFGITLPGPTLLVMSVASWISSGRILIHIALLVGAYFLISRLLRWLPLSFREWCDDRLGTLLGRNNALARFSQFTADLLEADLSVPSALRVAGFSIGSSRLQRSAWRLANDLERGPLLESRRERQFLTATVWHCLATDSPRPVQIHMLRELSVCFSQRVQNRLSWARGFIEPLAICVVGIIVGFTVLALFMPMLSLVSGLSGGW